MVIILSTENDHSTNQIISWLLHEQVDFIRINDSDILEFQTYAIGAEGFNFMFRIKNEFIDKVVAINHHTIYWYRRGMFVFGNNNAFRNVFEEGNKLFSRLNTYIKNEASYTTQSLHKLLSTLSHVNSFNDNDTNKLENIYLAQEEGIDIPDTIITSEKTALQHFMHKHKTIISKAVHNAFGYVDEKVFFDCMTHIFHENIFHEIPDRFIPTLFQEYIDKRYELRIFYLDGNFYASAIFSQQDEKTKVDFRRYNHEVPNRVVPYQLSPQTTLKLDRLMRKLKMNSGSIDMAVTPSGKEVFFEINPIGQFEQVSKPCNYYLEKLLATHLSHEKQPAA